MTIELRNGEDELHLEVNSIYFLKVLDFKYLKVNINNRNCIHDEIKLRIKVDNGCYFTISHHFKVKIL